MARVVFPIPHQREKESYTDNNNKSLLPSKAGQVVISFLAKTSIILFLRSFSVVKG